MKKILYVTFIGIVLYIGINIVEAGKGAMTPLLERQAILESIK